MTVAIYYFTGTGNCLAVAREVAAKMGCRPVSIASVIDDSVIHTDADTIGIVFPTHLATLHGVPLIVEGFLGKLEGLSSKRLFAICTCGGYEAVNAVPALQNLSRVVKEMGCALQAGYTVRLPMSTLDYEHIPIPIETDSAAIIERAKMQIEDVCARVIGGRRARHHVALTLLTFVMTPVYRSIAKSVVKWLKELAQEPADSALGFRELMPLTDRSIRVDDDCAGCGTCARVCPVGNIKLVDDKPVWQHHCEMCLACDEWCARGAIHHRARSDRGKYHHPEVRANDLYTDH